MKYFKYLLLIPVTSLAMASIWYVATGRDCIPGDYGGRWFALWMLSVFSCIGFGVCHAIENEGK